MRHHAVVDLVGGRKERFGQLIGKAAIDESGHAAT